MILVNSVTSQIGLSPHSSATPPNVLIANQARCNAPMAATQARYHTNCLICTRRCTCALDLPHNLSPAVVVPQRSCWNWGVPLHLAASMRPCTLCESAVLDNAGRTPRPPPSSARRQHLAAAAALRASLVWVQASRHQAVSKSSWHCRTAFTLLSVARGVLEIAARPPTAACSAADGPFRNQRDVPGNCLCIPW